MTEEWLMLRGSFPCHHFVTRRATINCQVLDLSPKAFAVLEYLMTHPNEVVSRERLLQLV